MSSEGFLWHLLSVATERHGISKKMPGIQIRFPCMIKQEKLSILRPAFFCLHCVALYFLALLFRTLLLLVVSFSALHFLDLHFFALPTLLPLLNSTDVRKSS